MFGVEVIASALFATLALAWLGWIVGRRANALVVPADGAERRDAAAPAVAIISVSPKGEVKATAEARRILSLPDAPTLTLAELAQHAGRAGEDLSEAVGRLMSTGARFQRVLETGRGLLVEARGVPEGFGARIALSDHTEPLRRAMAAEARLEVANRETAALREALNSVGAVAWLSGEDESAVWYEVTESGLSAEEQSRLIGAADLAGPRRSLVGRDAGDENPATGEGETAAGSTYQVAFSDPSRTRIAAKRIDDVVGLERLMNRLVHTMSETFAHLSVGLMIFDDRNRLTLFNPAIIEIFEEDAGWLATRPRLGDVLDRWRQVQKLPERLDFQDWRGRFVARNEDGEDTPLDEKWHLPDGRSLRVLRRSHPSGGLAIVVEDITESISLQRSSASERAIRSQTTDLMNEGLIVAGPDARVRMMNQAFRDFWHLDEERFPLGTHLSELLETCAGEDDLRIFWEGFHRAAAGSSERPANVQKVRRRDGRVLTARISAMPDRSTLAVFTDVTASETIAAALKERNEALEHADEMRSALVDQISLQMRTPLNTIYGFAQILEEERFGALNEPQREYVSGIVASSAELVEAISEMSDLISVGSEAAGRTTELCDPVAIFEDVAQHTANQLGKPTEEIKFKRPQKKIVFSGRPVRVRQILFNILTDAVSKSPEGANIHVTLGERKGSLTIAMRHAVWDGAEDGSLAISLARRSVNLNGGALTVQIGKSGERRISATLPGAEEMSDEAAMLSAAIAGPARASVPQ